MITINASVDRTSMMRTIQAMQQQGKAQGLTVRFICWDVLRAIILTAQKWTAPWAKGGQPGNTKAAEKTGKAAIAFDLFGKGKSARGIIGTITPEMKSYMDWNDKLPDHVLIRLKGGGVYLVDKNLYDASGSTEAIEKHHLKYRMKNGRVTTAGTRSKNIGRWKAVDKLFVTKDAATNYRKSVQARVGKLKAGWIPALYHYADLCNGSKGRLPQWILNQDRKGGGFGGTMDEKGNGNIFAYNTAKHDNALRPSSMQKAVDLNERTLKTLAYRRLDRLVAQFNAGKMPAPILKSEAVAA